jgi:5'-deoxynucleotidase
MTNENSTQRSQFFAYLSRLRWIKRWGLMRNAEPENVMEHSWEVAVIAHSLGVIRNAYFGGQLDTAAIATTALFHDTSEVLTGDLPTPVKYFHPSLTNAYRNLEQVAHEALLQTLPPTLQTVYAPLLGEQHWPEEHRSVIKAADTLSAYLKCLRELQAGNQEFAVAAKQLQNKLLSLSLPEVGYFLEYFVADCELTLDGLLLNCTAKIDGLNV